MKKKAVSLVLVVFMALSVLVGLTSCLDAPSTTTPQKLSAPIVTLTDNVATWAADTNADKFEISLDGNLSYVENTITAKALTNGQTLKVRAVGDGIAYSTSNWSNSVTFTENAPDSTPTKLDTPDVTISDTGLANWTAVENANSYVYKINEGAEIATTATSVQLTDGQSIAVKAVGDGTNYTDSDYSDSKTYTAGSPAPEPTKLGTPNVTISSTGLATWTAVANASSYVYKINGGAETSMTATAVQLTDGQSIAVKAVGDGTNYTDSDYSDSKTYTTSTPTPIEAPTYLGIFASNSEPSATDGLPDDFVVRPMMMSYRMMSARSNRTFEAALAEYFADANNHFNSNFPAESDYEVYARAGETVYIQIWLNNPNQHTILSLKLNGTKYQVGGGLSSFFIEDNGQHYNCVYVAVTVPSSSYNEKSYTVTDIEYIADTYINPDGTDEFMNNNDTVSIGLPYNAQNPTVSDYIETLVGVDSYEAEFTLTDAGNLVGISGGWLGVAVYDGYNIILNQALTAGKNQIAVSGLIENNTYSVVIYLYADLHDGHGVAVHKISTRDFTTLSAVEYFEVESGYYQNWGYPEMGIETDSGLSIDVSLSLTSPTATFDRLELYIGDELVYTKDDFNYYTTVEDLLANTTYLVKVYFSDSAYSEHSVEKYVTTGELDVPEMTLKEKYSFINSATFTFDYIQNGYLGTAITKNIKVKIYRDDIWQLEYAEYILMLCDDPTLVDRVQAEYDQAVENGDWGLASKIDHESLTYLKFARDIINDGELGDFGTDKAAWEEYFDTVSRTFYLNTDEFFGNSDTGNSYLIFRDYFKMFPTECNGRYKITADVNMKDGRGFVEKVINDGSIYNMIPINNENNYLEFDCEIDGLHVTVNPYFRVNYEDQKILVVSYKIGLYTMSGDLVDTLYTSKEVNWMDFDEETWINAYVCAMKGEAILPSREQIIEEFGWRAIFEILLNLDFGFEDDYIGGSGDIIVDGGEVVAPVIKGRGEKNIANQRERQILRDLLAYNYPDWYEYDLKTTMLEAFMCDEYYYDLIDGAEGIDAQLEALISGALNSSISRVIGDCESGIHHFLTWFGSEEDEIYIGFKTVIESYIEDTGKEPNVNWEESYRRIMMFEDFYKFYPFGYVEEFDIEIDREKYPTGEYMIGIEYRYDSYEENRYETRHYYNSTVKITGNLPIPSVEVSQHGYIDDIHAEIIDFWDYHFEIEIKNAQDVVIFSGNRDDLYFNENNRLYKGYSVRVRTVFNDGAFSNLYIGNSDWCDWLEFEGIKLDSPAVSYDEGEGAAVWYNSNEETSHYVYIINQGVMRTLSKNAEKLIPLENGDVLKIKAIPTDEAKTNGYVESDWAEFTCTDERKALSTPTNIRIEGYWLTWDSVNEADYYVIEITRGDEIRTVEESSTMFYDIEPGATYRVRARSHNYDIKSSLYSNTYTYSLKLDNPELTKANSYLISWSAVSYAEGYYYKIGANGQVQQIQRNLLYLDEIKINAGDQIYVQAYAEGCESSDWVLIYTKE